MRSGWLILAAAVGIIALWFTLGFLLRGNQKDPLFRISAGVMLILVATAITIVLFMIVTVIFGTVNFKRGFLNFLVGDNGTYSLSRLQAVLWAVVIMSWQFQLLICLCLNSHGQFLNLYQPVFSESAIWLLGLSLTSYVAVKGIAVNHLTNNPVALLKVKVKPRFRDILVGPNGLDFSKCQMLVWTILALAVFDSKCYYFNGQMLFGDRSLVIKLMNHFYDEYDATDKLADAMPWVPFLSWSFVVLMGLSQGVYVGKKLVPTFKLDDMKADTQQDIQSLSTQLNAKKQALQNILDRSAVSRSSPVDRANLTLYHQDIADTEAKIQELKSTADQITTYQNYLAQ